MNRYKLITCYGNPPIKCVLTIWINDKLIGRYKFRWWDQVEVVFMYSWRFFRVKVYVYYSYDLL